MDKHILESREQLMEDIDCIISEFFNDTWSSEFPDQQTELTKMLCDAVCKNFSLDNHE